MAGMGKDTWDSLLEQAGFRTISHMQGLGEDPAYQEIYIPHIRDELR